MTRVKISAAIILLLVGISVFSSVWINKKCDIMLSELTEMSRLSDKGDEAAVKELAEVLNVQWEDFRSKASVLLKYEKLVEVDRLCSRIGELVGKDDAELEAELSELNDMLEMLKSGETPLLNSVF